MLLTEERKKTVSVYAKTYREVKKKLTNAKIAAKESQLLILSGQNNHSVAESFQVVALKWLHDIQQYRKYPTYVKYKYIYHKYLSELDHIPMNQLDAAVIEERLTLLNIQESVSLRKSVYAVLNQIIKYANREHGFTLSTYKWKAQTEKKKKIEVLNQTEQAKLLNVLFTQIDICKAGILLCLCTGLRLGEICALKWEDIDLCRKVLYVKSTVQRIVMEGYATKSILFESNPKSPDSMREIPLSDDIVQLLASFPRNGIYVLNADKPMEPRTYQNKLKAYLRDAGVDYKNFHALRHTFATNCIQSGMDVKSLSEILGHADVKITLNRYVVERHFI